MMGNKDRKLNGFSLVELLVVIAIISIITVLTLGQFQTARKKAADGQRKGDINALTKALQMYYADYGVFPRDIGGSISIPNGMWTPTILHWGGEFKDNATPPYTYMKVLPKEKSAGLPPLCYVSQGSSYGIFSMLENTNDTECIRKIDEDEEDTGGGGIYTHCGNIYCYAVVSPNILATDLDGVTP